jgi:Ca-activated chloride channel family protein
MLKAAVLFASILAAQDRPAFRSTTELVTVPCTVVDSHGAPVPDLTRDDFRLFDNDVPRVITQFWLDTDQPITLAVLLDASQSQRAEFDEHRRTAADLLRRILRPGDRSFLVAIDEDIRLWSDLDSATGPIFGDPCPKQASNAPGVRPTSICGGSPIWNAVYDTARLKLRPLTGAKAILLLTDGFDTGSTHTFAQAIAEAQRADTAVYAIQYPGALGSRYAPDLFRLVSGTAGASFPPPVGNYDSIVTRLETDLRHRYVLAFHPEKLNFNKPQHDLRVEVTRPNLNVRARKSYLLTP